MTPSVVTTTVPPSRPTPATGPDPGPEDLVEGLKIPRLRKQSMRISSCTAMDALGMPIP